MRLRASGVIFLMLLCGVGVNRAIALRQAHLGENSTLSSTAPRIDLPGTIYVSQSGNIYSISHSSVQEVRLPSGGSWTQPRVLPDGSLLVVRRFAEYSDLYHVSADGSIIAQLTHNDQATNNATLQLDHWIVYPAVSPDGNTIYFATDAPKPAPGVSYEVDFAIWSAPLNGAPWSISDTGVSSGIQWSTPDNYTGGDVEPVPLSNGEVVYASYAVSGTDVVFSVIGLQTQANGPMVSLTTQAQNCGAPAVAPGGTAVAMVCSPNDRTASLEVATLSGTTLSTPKVVVSDCLCNSPTWAPDGSGLLFMDAAGANGNFGLWYVAHPQSHPSTPTRVTDPNSNLDATSAAAWSE